jgi:TRAP-type C4-dicarboxylate transport system permease small subunit
MTTQFPGLRKLSYSGLLSGIGNIAIAGMMFLTTADVIGRLAFHSPVLGAYDITEYLMMITVFSFLSFTQREKAHIRVDFIFNLLPKKLQTFYHFLNSFLSLVIAVIVTWMAVPRVMELLETGEESALLRIPNYPFAIFMVIGLIALCLEFLNDTIDAAKNREEQKEL